MMLVGSDILMIAAGILSACLDRQRQWRMMLFYYVVSCIFYVIMLCIINVRLTTNPAPDPDPHPHPHPNPHPHPHPDPHPNPNQTRSASPTAASSNRPTQCRSSSAT